MKQIKFTGITNINNCNALNNRLRAQLCFLIFFTFCTFFSTKDSFAVTSIATIQQKVLGSSSDKDRLTIYKNVVRTNELENADSLIKLLDLGVALFTEHQYEEGVADLQISLGFTCSKRRLLELAETNLQQSLAYFEGAGNKLKTAEIYNLLGVVAGRRLHYDKAIKNFLKALEIYEQEKNINGMVSAYLKLGVAHELNGNHQNAFAHYKKGIALLGDDTLNTDYINLNNNIGTLFGRLEKFDSAHTYLIRALNGSRGGAETASLRILSLSNLGNVLKEKGQYAVAALYYNEALMLAEKQNSPEDIIRVKINMAILQSFTDPSKAEIIFNDALKIVRQIDGKNYEAEILNGIAGVYKAQGRYKEALVLNERREELEDSLYNIEKAAEIANLELGYELGKTNQTLAELRLSKEHILKQRNTIRIVAVLLGLSFLILFFFFWKLKQLNLKLHSREAQLQKANQTKDTLFSIIGHDLRNPITNMVMVLEIVIAQNIRTTSEDKLLNQLKEDSVTTLQTLDNLMKWGSAQLSEAEANKREFSAKNLVEAEFKQLTNIAAQKGVTLSETIPENVALFMDAEHYKCIVRNLIFNAIKFTPSGGKVQFSVDSVAQYLYKFSVTDNGVGITAEKKATLFQQFGASEYGTENEKGSGIGLMLCKLFVEQNGGHISVQDNPSGQGTIFSFTANKPQVLS